MVRAHWTVGVRIGDHVWRLEELVGLSDCVRCLLAFFITSRQ
jgi:hypothetical protein